MASTPGLSQYPKRRFLLEQLLALLAQLVLLALHALLALPKQLLARLILLDVRLLALLHVVMTVLDLTAASTHSCSAITPAPTV